MPLSKERTDEIAARFVNWEITHGNGIRKEALSQWLDRPVSDAEAQSLSRIDAEALIKDRFIYAQGFNEIDNEELAMFVIDAALNNGPFNVVRWLREAAGIDVNGGFDRQMVDVMNGPDALRIATGITRGVEAYHSNPGNPRGFAMRYFGDGANAR